jgi:predicted GIY-YIG superfamily endonuclease
MCSINIYVLKLEDGKYYIGKTNDVESRFKQHINGKGSAWTRKYRPISVLRTILTTSDFEEDKVTKEYMAKYGIDNVRGGAYVEVELSELQIESLHIEIWSAKGHCTQCGRPGHFVKDCYAKTDVNGNKIIYEDDTESESSFHEEWVCDHCEKDFATKKECLKHENHCRERKSSTCGCYRCGREGHYSYECYATRHLKGYYIDD